MRYRSPRASRRGVTLVEMLVAVTLLVLMMTVIVMIFSSATGAVSGLQVYQQLDGDLRQLDITIRRDLIGVTARMTPPLNPRDGLGYFEYGENAFADIQQEDTDDYIRFTAKAPEGQPFTGRVWLNPLSNVSLSGSSAPQPVMVTSDFAEIIYFLRNGNLYRRVLLVAPNRQASVDSLLAAFLAAGRPLNAFGTGVLGNGSLPMSWQGVNDLSAHPAPSGSLAARTHPIVLNTLSDLTNRENRFAYSRYANDYVKHLSKTAPTAGTPDGIPDDENPDKDGNIVGDGVTDYPPVLYSQIFTATPNVLIGESLLATRLITTDTMAFPYLFPGAYSQPDTYNGALTNGGWIHSTDRNPAVAFTGALDQLSRINHSPLESGDSLPPPGSNQTWWGFPTWRETLLPQWSDPYHIVADGTRTPPFQQPLGLRLPVANSLPSFTGNVNALPPMTSDLRGTPQPFNDGAGSDLFSSSSTASTQSLWRASWEDDLIMTGVRSFDVKIYDNTYPGYVDLGWGDDLRLHPATTPNPTVPTGTAILSQPNGLMFSSATPSFTYWNGGFFHTLNQSFAHEGRMPPLSTDLRFDAQYPVFNVGDDQAAVQRLRRVWDTWSTDYAQSPATAFDPTTKLPVGPPWSKPVYPSYPPPYPVAMRGLQIQIKVVDPRNEKVKTLTIRQDFSDKL